MGRGHLIARGLMAALGFSAAFLATGNFPGACAAAVLIWLAAVALAWAGDEDEGQGGLE